MDLRMPRMDGIEATRLLTDSGCSSRVLVLTTFDGDELLYGALRAGAVGYLLKDAGGRRLVEAVEAAAAGEMPLAPGVVARLVASYVRRPQTPCGASERLAPLSEREVGVLRLIGAGRSNPEIADQLFISLATVKTHVRHILAKLDLRDRAQAIVLAHELGLVEERAAERGCHP
jgi:DNA-binding NarL/FixJ family response regulator